MRRDARHRREHTSALRLSNPRCSYFCSFKSDCNYSRNQWSKRCRLFRRVSRALTLPCDRWLCSRHRRFFDSLLLITGLLCFLNARLEISVRLYCLTRWLQEMLCSFLFHFILRNGSENTPWRTDYANSYVNLVYVCFLTIITNISIPHHSIPYYYNTKFNIIQFLLRINNTNNFSTLLTREMC